MTKFDLFLEHCVNGIILLVGIPAAIIMCPLALVGWMGKKIYQYFE